MTYGLYRELNDVVRHLGLHNQRTYVYSVTRDNLPCPFYRFEVLPL